MTNESFLTKDETNLTKNIKKVLTNVKSGAILCTVERPKTKNNFIGGRKNENNKQNNNSSSKNT